MKVFLTGAGGFLGQHVLEELVERDHRVTYPARYEVDLRNPSAAERAIREAAPDAVIHLAAVVGGIGANQARPADFWRENLLIGLNVIEACRACGVRRLILAGTTCSYPRDPTMVPFPEEELFRGYPEGTNAPYGIAKLALIEGLRAYRRQYGLESIAVVPTNLYGPGDNFDPDTSHVIPAIIRKMHAAKLAGNADVLLWGDGSPTRDFLYAKDAARGFALALEAKLQEGIFNLGSGVEISIADIAEQLKEVVGFGGRVEWDRSKPNGQPRRCLDVRKAERDLGWRASTPLQAGLRSTYAWWTSRRQTR